eukprot:scaffold448_cov239-Chaetoceros_neogracile.AAC.3
MASSTLVNLLFLLLVSLPNPTAPIPPTFKISFHPTLPKTLPPTILSSSTALAISLPRGGSSRAIRRRKREARRFFSQAFRRHKRETRRFAAINAALYAALHWCIVTFGEGVVPVGCCAVFCAWMVAIYLVPALSSTTRRRLMLSRTNLHRCMNKHFMAPASWPSVRKRPYCVFGSAFSHMSPSHIAANLATYLTFAPELVKMTGRAGFAHAYLLSALTSQLFVCCWHKWAPADKRVRGENGEIEGLGASGAISGISAGIKDDDKDDKKNIAFDMHVGGAVGGAFFWAVWQVLGKGG